MLTMPKIEPAYLKGEKQCRLSNVGFFKRVPLETLRGFERDMIEKRYGSQESIFLEDDQAEFVWLVKGGHVRETHHSTEGGSQTVGMIGPGGLFGISAFIDGGQYGFHSVAETDATVFSFPVRSFQDLMGRCPAMARIVLSQISQLLRRSKDMQIFSRENAEKRLLHALMEMVVEFGGTIPLTRRRIAEMAGTSVETCIRIFGRLEAQGLIASVRGKIIVSNLEDLKDRMEEGGSK